MIYSKCAVCRAAVHRYRASRPRRGEIANAGQDGLAVEAVHAAVSYGELAAAVAARRRQPRARVMDLLIAASAHAHSARLYTRNADDLPGIEHLLDMVAV